MTVIYEITSRGKELLEDPSYWGDVPTEARELLKKTLDDLFGEPPESETLYKQRFLIKYPEFLEIV